MRTKASHPVFALELLGDAVQSGYRARRPHLDAMPWGTLHLQDVSPETLLACRRWWTEFALQEYASAASQTRMLQLVLRAGAPLDLSALLMALPFDELVHTEMCALVIADLGGAIALQFDRAAMLGGAPEMTDAPLLDAAVAVARQLCVAEQCTLGTLHHRRKHAGNPLYEAVWGRMARDEGAHARGGWLLLNWAWPALREQERVAVAEAGYATLGEVERADSKAAELDDSAFHPLSVFGAAGRDAYLAAAAQARADATALLERWVRTGDT